MCWQRSPRDLAAKGVYRRARPPARDSCPYPAAAASCTSCMARFTVPPPNTHLAPGVPHRPWRRRPARLAAIGFLDERCTSRPAWAQAMTAYLSKADRGAHGHRVGDHLREQFVGVGKRCLGRQSALARPVSGRAEVDQGHHSVSG